MAEMTHAYIEAHDVAARYATGRLTADEERDFEAHMLDCPKCLEDVACETGLREGLRDVANESATALRPAARRRLWRGPPISTFLAAAAAILLVTAVSLGVALGRSSAALRSARADGEARAAQAEQSASAAQRQLADAERRAADASTRAATPPVTAASIFALTSVRDGSSRGAPPVNQIAVSGDAGLVVFSLDLPNPSDSAEYRVSLKDGAGRASWTGGPYRASSPDVLAVAVDSKRLPPGDYTLELQQQTGAQPATVAGRYPIRVSAR
jgi:hypothetical protein